VLAMGEEANATVAERLRSGFERLTRAERQLASILLSNYPVAGLNTVAELARKSNVSGPTVIRMVQKLGYAGFPEFQNALRDELQAQLSTPLAKYERSVGHMPDAHRLARFSSAVVDNLDRSLTLTDHHEFDAIVALLVDLDRSIYTVGGRLSRVLADYLFTQLHGIRSGVDVLPANATLWPQCLVDMRQGDVLVVFDVRRYERDLIELARLAAARDVVVVLFTDQWMSPISAVARKILALRIEAPSSWDSLAVPMVFVEALLAAAGERLWPAAADRLSAMEKLFDDMKQFRK
jgi:DNA-binding MurR/RpiR family transcriptional regulator